MADFRKAIRNAGINIDEPRVMLDLARQRERANWLATRYGLPAIGSRAVNRSGIEWVVQEHIAVPSYDSLHRWREREVVPSQDLYPVIASANLSPRLTAFISSIDRCTTKSFVIVDTIPGRRDDGQVPGGNYIDTLCHPTANVIFVDAARVNETILAHEFGHAWVQYVDECEDLRVLADASDPQKMRLVGLIQSFVIDLKVNDLLLRKGFDMAPVEDDQVATIMQLAQFLNNGGTTKYPREEVLWAANIAEWLLRPDASLTPKLNEALTAIGKLATSVMELAEEFANAVRKQGYSSLDDVVACVDACLISAFGHCGEHINLNQELILVPSQEPNLDKWPAWMRGASPELKVAVAKVMGRENVPIESKVIIVEECGQARVHFILADGSTTESWMLTRPLPLNDPLQTIWTVLPPQQNFAERIERQVAEVSRMNRRNQERQRQMFEELGVHIPTLYDPQNRTHQPLVNAQPATPQLPKVAHSNHLRLGVSTLPSNLSPFLQASISTSNPPSLPARIRPYMAGLGRFLTAARLQYQLEGEHAYAYALNNPVAHTDPSGLNPMLTCSDDCESSCDKFITDNPRWCNDPPPTPPYPPGLKTMAFAFCCKGKPHHCYCPGMKPKNPYILACVAVHERGHIPPGGCTPGYTGPPGKINNECTAAKAGIKCATEQCRRTISNDCIELDEWRCSECRRLKVACEPMPSKDWLEKYCAGCGVS